MGNVMVKFTPNETIVRGFGRVAKASGSKLKAYLLKKAGLASHDLRIFLDKNQPIEWYTPNAMESFFFAKVFSRVGWNTRATILNVSGTDPVLCEEHFFMEVPSELPLEFELTEEVDGGYKTRRTKTYAGSRNHLSTEDPRSVELPVLKKGVGHVVPQRTFGFPLTFPLKTDIHHKINNDEQYRPDDDLMRQCAIAYGELLDKCSFWYGLVLDNEELLPFEWSRSDGRFVPGFFTDGTVVPPAR
jgi:hypothetical protein